MCQMMANMTRKKTSVLRGVRILKNKLEMEPTIQSPSSASVEEEMWNRSFAENGYIINSTSSLASMQKESNSKPMTMGLISKMKKNYEEYDDNQTVLALLIDHKQERVKIMNSCIWPRYVYCFYVRWLHSYELHVNMTI